MKIHLTCVDRHLAPALHLDGPPPTNHFKWFKLVHSAKKPP